MNMNNGGMMPQLRLARAYVPIQEFGSVFPPLEALRRGTLFPDLYIPYVPPTGFMEVDGK